MPSYFGPVCRQAGNWKAALRPVGWLQRGELLRFTSLVSVASPSPPYGGAPDISRDTLLPAVWTFLPAKGGVVALS